MNTPRLSEYMDMLGKVGTLSGRNPAVNIRVRIEDIRIRFGHTDYLITPVEGSGTTWVESTRVQID